MSGSEDTLQARSRRRRAQIKVHRARTFEDAERWDLEYWQSQTPAARLAALIAIHQDVEKARGTRVRS